MTPEPDDTRRDRYLNRLVTQIDLTTEKVTKDDGFHVTLCTAGGTITGVLVPQWQYAASFTSSTGNAPFEEDEKAAYQYADDRRQLVSFTGPDPEPQHNPDEEAPSEYFLTLGWARVFIPGASPTTESWIRVRRDDIIAWHLGELNAT